MSLRYGLQFFGEDICVQEMLISLPAINHILMWQPAAKYLLQRLIRLAYIFTALRIFCQSLLRMKVASLLWVIRRGARMALNLDPIRILMLTKEKRLRCIKKWIFLRVILHIGIVVKELML